jgi:negative regulator of flagellin synthesis FlgM
MELDSPQIFAAETLKSAAYLPICSVVEEYAMNLSGILNGLPDLLRSQQTGNTAATASSAKTPSAQATQPNGGKTDQADLSSTGLAAAQAASSDVRMEKVQSVRSAIDAGTYQVSAGDVADKMMQSLLG